jgi:hypothetical protein
MFPPDEVSIRVEEKINLLQPGVVDLDIVPIQIEPVWISIPTA